MRSFALLVVALLFISGAIAGIGDAPPTILDLQQFRTTCSIRIQLKGRQGTASLVNLNPAINVWYLLKVSYAGVNSEVAYHLENPKPGTQKLLLEDSNPSGVVIVAGNNRYACNLFDTEVLSKGTRAIYEPLCEGRIYLRNSATGHRTSLEAATEFLRDHVWGGEKIIELGHMLVGETHRETGKLQGPAHSSSDAQDAKSFPHSATIDAKFRDRLLTSVNLGIDVGGAEKSGMTPGAWYAASGNPGVFVSILQPNLIDPEILKSYKSRVNALDEGEAPALCYLIAFDLQQLDLGYALGTEHPRVEWSDHMLEQMKDPRLPGPDGIGSIRPLTSTGLVSPFAAGKTVATFTGGFKRAHGAFKYGELALKNHGTHYGFVENGVVFSTLQAGLATLVVINDGSIQMKTWSDADSRLLPQIKHARQNGVPLIESNEPGSLVVRWGPGNWSGSEDRKLRTMRSGIGMQGSGDQRFLVYAVFTSATPSAMVRVFQAFHCEYAMLLDMNALEHTYCALYRRSGSKVQVDHLIRGMSQVDQSGASGEMLPRFLAYPDNRDFFYVMRRDQQETKR